MSFSQSNFSINDKQFKHYRAKDTHGSTCAHYYVNSKIVDYKSFCEEIVKELDSTNGLDEVIMAINRYRMGSIF